MEKTGLVLEGGGMRGIYTAGVLEFLMEKNLYFPYVIGVSAGACHAASYLSRQRGRNKKVIIDYIKHPRYLSLQNFLKQRELFGMDFIFDDIPNIHVPFDFQAYRNGTEEFVIGTTDCETGKPVYFSREETGEDLLTYIRASSSLPFFSPVVSFKGKKLLDGGISDSVPILKSEKDGNKKNVVILTRNKGYKKSRTKMEWLLRRSYKEYPKLMETMLSRYQLYNDTTAYIEDEERKGNVFVIRPLSPMQVGRVERNPVKLEKLYEQGYHDAASRYTSLQNWME
ncbi:patatin family protein [Bacillus lacus]|uniref:Patatin family protein n=1 Tax=Metabacillus lacus TaxID=1983721 RepID=A0A7X2M013_9BACI|nr:patatin family protein [Metabacillus lacus]MRX72289.1 patatin family protein [Metabacillus lacus]